MEFDETKQFLTEGVKKWSETGMRWSYVAIGGLVVLGAAVNLFLPRGWVVWPLVLVAGIMLMLHEAAERNENGVPPFHAYAFFICAILFWALLAALMSVIGPALLVVGLPAAAYYCIRVYWKYRRRMAQIEERRRLNLCVVCGEEFHPKRRWCDSCGQDPVGDGSRLIKLEDFAARTQVQVERSRSILKGELPTIAARRKEQALLAQNKKGRSTKGTPPNSG